MDEQKNDIESKQPLFNKNQFKVKQFVGLIWFEIKTLMTHILVHLKIELWEWKINNKK